MVSAFIGKSVWTHWSGGSGPDLWGDLWGVGQAALGARMAG
jgi:hypothetical protein